MTPPATTALGALLNHITGGADAETFQPMNVNFGLFPDLEGKIKGRDRKLAYTRRALADLDGWLGRRSQAAANTAPSSPAIPSRTCLNGFGIMHLGREHVVAGLRDHAQIGVRDGRDQQRRVGGARHVATQRTALRAGGLSPDPPPPPRPPSALPAASGRTGGPRATPCRAKASFGM